jgi:hypothetical protein
VSAKRSQLHAANLAHMPRYLFEQKLNTACDETGLHKPWQAKPVPVPLVPPSTPKYQLNFTSTYGAASLNNTTLALLRKLDKYEGALGKLRMDHQRTIACLDKQSTYYQMAVKSMALGLWNYVSAGEDREMSMKVRDQFLGQVEYLYGWGQRLTEVPAVQPPKAARYRDYADDVYDYILTGSNELYGRQRLLEANLDAKLAQYKLETRPYVISAFRDFARDACDFYIIDKMPNCNALTTGHVYTLQTILVDAYLAGDRR